MGYTQPSSWSYKLIIVGGPKKKREKKQIAAGWGISGFSNCINSYA